MLFPYVFVFVCVLYLCVFCICISGIFIAGLLWRVGRAQAGGSSPLIRRESWARLKACLPTQGPTRACTKLVPPTPDVATPKYAHSGAHWGMHQHLWPPQNMPTWGPQNMPTPLWHVHVHCPPQNMPKPQSRAAYIFRLRLPSLYPGST